MFCRVDKGCTKNASTWSYHASSDPFAPDLVSNFFSNWQWFKPLGLKAANLTGSLEESQLSPQQATWFLACSDTDCDWLRTSEQNIIYFKTNMC